MNETLEDKKATLKARADALAREPDAEATTEDCLELVEFMLAGEKYAIESPRVREVYALRELTPLPCTPPFVLGIVNVRGQILTVIDMRCLFELPQMEVNNSSRIIIVETGGAQVGLLAEDILGVCRIRPDDLQASLPTLTGILAEYLRGVTGGRTAVLDVAAILTDDRIILNEEVQT